ncbi:unnamed protein product [Closterium sp. NIES-54]
MVLGTSAWIPALLRSRVDVFGMAVVDQIGSLLPSTIVAEKLEDLSSPPIHTVVPLFAPGLTAGLGYVEKGSSPTPGVDVLHFNSQLPPQLLQLHRLLPWGVESRLGLGCSPSPLLPFVASAAAADLGGFESVGAASAPSGSRRTGRSKGGRGARGGGGGGGAGGGGSGGGWGGGGGGGGGGGVGSSNGGGGGGGGGGGNCQTLYMLCLGPERPHPERAARPEQPEPSRPNRAAQPKPSRAALPEPSRAARTGPSRPACLWGPPTAITLTTAMASPPVLAFDAEGRPVKFDTWLDDLHLFLQLTAKEDISLYDHALGQATAPAATADSTARSQWQTRDAHARFAIRNSLPIDEREHFGQHKTAQALYTAVVARYSSPASAALGHLSLPYLFPDLASFTTVADLITHLRTSEARFRAAMPDEFLAKNPPPLWLTLYHLVTRLPDTLCSVRDHFLARCPTELTIALLKKELLAAETSIVAVGRDFVCFEWAPQRQGQRGQGRWR